MTYKSGITKLNIKPGKMLLVAILFFIVFAVAARFTEGAILVVPLFASFILLVDSAVSKLRDLLTKKSAYSRK